MDWEEHVRGKKVLFITTKQIFYLRNTQEIEILKRLAGQVDIIGSKELSYRKRLLGIYKKLFQLKKNSYDVVFVGFAPQLVLPFFSYKWKKAYVIQDFFISMYDTFICDRKRFKEGGLVSYLLHHLDEKTLKRSDCVITDTKAHKQYFIEEFGMKEEKGVTLYLKADTSIYYPKKGKKKKEWTGKKVILYFGSILPLQGVEYVLEAISQFEKEADKYHFIVIGPVKLSEKEKKRRSNVTFIDWVSQEELANCINSADLCLAGHFNSASGKANRTIPGKAYIYRACEKPMILGENQANHEIFSSDAETIFVKMGSADAIAQGIRNFFETK